MNRIFVITVSVFVGLLVAAAPAEARGRTESRATVTAVGLGELVVEPDQAIVTVGVQLYNESVQNAAADLRGRMESVISAIRELGVSEQSIQTTNYSIFFERDHQAPPSARLEGGRPSGIYRVENMVRVTISDVSRAAAVVEAAVQAGANQMYGIQFTLSAPGEYDTKVREAAVANARERAEGLARAAGRELGAAVEITEIVAGGPGAAFESRAMGLGGGPVQPGGLEYTSRVQVTYELE